MANIRKPVNSTEPTKIRKSIFDRRDRLSFKKDKRFYTQWVHDVDDRIKQFLDAGFQFMTEDERWGRVQDREVTMDAGTNIDSRVSENVGMADGLDNVQAYLMRIPIDEWNEMVAPEKEERQNALKNMQSHKFINVDKDSFYGDYKPEVK